MSELRKTPLNEEHKKLKARLVDFTGWEMPVQYAGIIEEHKQVRTHCGMFDVSHMGEIEVKGKDAERCLQYLLTNDASTLFVNQSHYSGLCYPNGGFVDDLLVYKINDEHFMLCVNASNTEKDYQWMVDNNKTGARIINASADFAQISVQGPKTKEILKPLVDLDLYGIKYYWFDFGKVCGKDAIISATGYTGERGFEFFLEPEDALPIWREILKAGKDYGLCPVGLGARNTLRLEAKMALYGNDIWNETTPLEADLEWICKFDKPDFVGKSVMIKQKNEGIKRKLVGFETIEKGIPRQHYEIQKNGEKIGEVTSGTFAPYLEKNIGLGYINLPYDEIGTEIEIIIRDKPIKAVVVNTPFYNRPVKKKIKKG
ncbi:glycine cleavage system aminomethyltransferase GcvT [bacterium]|nr:glycine cleavage system aminomethyltransferase GcvT [bacterium]